MKRWIVIALILAVVGGAAYWAYGQQQAQQAAEAAAQAAAEEQAAGDLEQVIWASGRLQPLTWAGLAPAGGGVVQAIHVAEGDTVAATAIREAQTAVTAAQERQAGAEAAVRAALAQAASAQAALDKLLAGATAEDIAIAQAHRQAAQAALESAQAQLRQSQVFAPFAGQVGAVNVRLGELIAPGAYAILLGDTSRLHVETTDLRETDVVRVQVGMPVEVTFDALPDRIFAGTVTQVAPVSSAEKGSTNYTVDVAVEALDPGLRWGMTAFVNIRPRE